MYAHCSWKNWTQMEKHSYFYVSGEELLYNQFKRSLLTPEMVKKVLQHHTMVS